MERDPGDSFDVVVPSMPGYGFSDRPLQPGINTFAIAELWAALMGELGYGHFGCARGRLWGQCDHDSAACGNADRVAGDSSELHSWIVSHRTWARNCAATRRRAIHRERSALVPGLRRVCPLAGNSSADCGLWVERLAGCGWLPGYWKSFATGPTARAISIADSAGMNC